MGMFWYLQNLFHGSATCARLRNAMNFRQLCVQNDTPILLGGHSRFHGFGCMPATPSMADETSAAGAGKRIYAYLPAKIGLQNFYSLLLPFQNLETSTVSAARSPDYNQEDR